MIVALVLLSAFLHAGWNALLRVEPDKDRGLVGAITIASVFACVIAGVRWALGETPFETWESVLYTLLAGAFEAVYFATLARALELGRLGAVYTVSRGGAVLVVWPVSILLFHEVATLTSTAGSIVVLLGLTLSSISSTSGGNRSHRAGIGWAVACAASIAGYHLAYKGALLAGGNPSATFGVSLALSALISLIRIGGGGRRILVDVLRVRWFRVALMGIVCGGSFLILMEALSLGGAGYVLTLRNTSVLFAAGLALTIGERPVHSELVGAALVAAGAVLMSL